MESVAHDRGERFILGGVKTFPYEGKGDRLRWMRSREPECPMLQFALPKRALSPLFTLHSSLSTLHSFFSGKGDRSAVDEVKMRTVPLSRSVYCLLPIAYCLLPHAKCDTAISSNCLAMSSNGRFKSSVFTVI